MVQEAVHVNAGGDITALKGPWTEIEQAGGVSHPMYSWPWISTWWEVFGQDCALTAMILREGNRPLAIAPFVRHRVRMNRVFSFSRLEIMGTGEEERDEVLSECVDLPCIPGTEARSAEELAQGLMRNAGADWEDIVLHRVRRDSLAYGAFRKSAEAENLPACDLASEACPHVRLPRTFEEYERQLSSNRRQQIKRGLRRLEGMGAVQFEKADTLESALATLETLAQLHQERWTSRGKPGVFASPRFMRFHRLFIERAFPLGWPELWTLRLNGRPLVCLYSINYRGRIAFYQSGMRVFEQENAVRPGMLAHYLAIRAAIESGATEYDFMMGQSRYKTSLSNASRELVTLRIHRRSLKENLRRTLCAVLAQVRPPASRPSQEQADASQ